jgi:hypothetical protein
VIKEETGQGDVVIHMTWEEVSQAILDYATRPYRDEFPAGSKAALVTTRNADGISAKIASLETGLRLGWIK